MAAAAWPSHNEARVRAGLCQIRCQTSCLITLLCRIVLQVPRKLAALCSAGPATPGPVLFGCISALQYFMAHRASQVQLKGSQAANIDMSSTLSLTIRSQLEQEGFLQRLPELLAAAAATVPGAAR